MLNWAWRRKHHCKISADWDICSRLPRLQYRWLRYKSMHSYDCYYDACHVMECCTVCTKTCKLSSSSTYSNKAGCSECQRHLSQCRNNIVFLREEKMELQTFWRYKDTEWRQEERRQGDTEAMSIKNSTMVSDFHAQCPLLMIILNMIDL